MKLSISLTDKLQKSINKFLSNLKDENNRCIFQIVEENERVSKSLETLRHQKEIYFHKVGFFNFILLTNDFMGIFEI